MIIAAPANDGSTVLADRTIRARAERREPTHARLDANAGIGIRIACFAQYTIRRSLIMRPCPIWLLWLLTVLACESVSPPARSVQLDGIPLVEVPSARPGDRMLALVLSGDGDWAELVDGFARILADSGIAVIGVRSRSYLSAPGRNPDATARDMTLVLRTYLERWSRDEIVIAGYSRGADLAPFIVAGLPDDLRQRVRLVALLSPATATNFRFHYIDLVSARHRPSDVPVLPALMSIRGTAILCVYGRLETDSLCPTAPPARMHVVVRSGGHHTTDSRLLARLVIDQLTAPGVRDTTHRVGVVGATERWAFGAR
jgi:type IV secretory pathway VirJ component